MSKLKRNRPVPHDRVRWVCPQCEKRYLIPVGAEAPELCPTCEGPGAESNEFPKLKLKAKITRSLRRSDRHPTKTLMIWATIAWPVWGLFSALIQVYMIGLPTYETVVTMWFHWAVLKSMLWSLLGALVVNIAALTPIYLGAIGILFILWFAMSPDRKEK